MPNAFRNDEQNLYRFSLLEENYEAALAQLKSIADRYQKSGTNYLAEKHYREALIHLIFEYYYREMTIDVANNKQAQLKTCAVNLSKAWNSLFHPQDAKVENVKPGNTAALGLAHK